MINHKEINDILGRDGAYSNIQKDYEFREHQIELATHIADALNENKILLAEAGTGVGKTMAYLVPSILKSKEGDPVVISTNTIALQSQLLAKDIPDIARAMADIEFRTVLVKGRGNYVCLTEVDNASGNILFATNKEFERLKRWIKRTKTGDFQDLTFDFPEWYEVASNVHTCRKEECSYYQTKKCFYYKMREKAEYANILVTNHSLFFSDLAAKAQDPYAGVLPPYSTVIFDEAHHIEDNASKTFGAEVTSFNIPFLVKRLKNRRDINITHSVLDEILAINDKLFLEVSKISRMDYFLEDLYGEIDKASVLGSINDLLANINTLVDDLNNAKKTSERETKNKIDGYISMIEELQASLKAVFFPEEDENYFQWGENKPSDKYSNCTLHSSPVAVSEILRDNLFSLGIPIVMTSATLSNAKSFSYIKNRLGLDGYDNMEEIILGSPFDYMEQTLLYVPDSLPAPSNEPDYVKKISSIIEELITASKGNAFVLFTSYKMLNFVYDDLVLTSKYKLIRQGEMPNEELLKTFKKNDDTVLFGVHSFWEGIDVKGSKLKLVIIDKIPFAVPDNPVTKSRCDYIEKNNGNPFREYSIPQAIIKLKQGFGRLIRTRSDKGVVAILDSRIHSKFYRVDILNSLPRCKGTKKLEKAKTFLDDC